MEWLLAWMQKYGSADVLNRDLVDEYLSVSGANFKIVFFGAPKCPQLGSDLSRMARLGYDKRRTTGIGDGLCHQGFPRWVWSYSPGKFAKYLAPE